MDQWKDRVAVITGSSSGIGAQIAIDLAEHGVIVAALARRANRLNEVRESVSSEKRKNFHCYTCDVTNYEQLEKTFESIETDLGGVDILINNAGVLKHGFLTTLERDVVKQVMDTNVTAAIDCTRLSFKSMQKRNVNGHVLLINSITGHKVLDSDMTVQRSINFYPASKFALTAMTEIYRQEFFKLGTKVKITSVSPGLIKTEMTTDQCAVMTYLVPKDVSNAVLYILGTPPNVQIHELTIKPVGELF